MRLQNWLSRTAVEYASSSPRHVLGWRYPRCLGARIYLHRGKRGLGYAAAPVPVSVADGRLAA
jgi:hypothetical protein